MKRRYRKVTDCEPLSVGDAVKSAREMLEMNQAELARATGIRQSHLSEIERGKRVVGRAVAEKLAKALELHPSHLLFVGDRMRTGADQIEALVMKILKNLETIESANASRRHALVENVASQVKEIQRLNRSNLPPSSQARPRKKASGE